MFNVSLLSSTGRKWFDCAECHMEQEDHPLLQKFDMVRCLAASCDTLSLNHDADLCLQKM